ncbi:MAG: DSD1 family PLP-dependent enzyme [Hyphomicrobiaceae bacterium]|nr:DSD1 family PLP-dependent enzyme [Hyphomicrobiaceae bacterium]
MHEQGPNASLIGQPQARQALATPCLVLELNALARNLVRTADTVRASGMVLRPHAKTHKCASLARLQMELGSDGIAVATVGEAECFAAAGIEDILITSTFFQPAKIKRVLDLAAASGQRISIVVDDPDAVAAIGQATSARRQRLDVLIDVDLGRHRAGVRDEAQAVALAADIANFPYLRLTGIQAYAGHLSHVANFSERRDLCIAAAQFTSRVRQALEAAGHTIGIVTGISTGSLFIDAALGVYTEAQCGSYVGSDVEYDSIDLDGTGQQAFEPALFLRTSVIDRNWPGRVTVDAGYKHFSAKSTLPRLVPSEALRGARYKPDSDEHGFIELPPGVAQPPLGTSFECLVPHCDPTLNLYNQLHVVDGDRLVDIWLIEARGAF